MENNRFTSFRILLFGLLITSGILLNSCNGQDELAEVNDHVLYEEDANILMTELGYDATKKEDQVIFVNKWVESMMMQDELESTNLNQSLVADFRASLFKGELSNYLLTEMELMTSVDTTASEKEISAYYEKHASEFELQDFIVKALFIKLPKAAPKMDEIKASYLLKNDKDIARIESYAKLYADDFYFDDQNWISFQEMRKKMPSRSMNLDNVVLNRTKTYFSDDEFVYFINILDYKLKSESPPLEFVRDHVKERIIGQRMNSLRTEVEKKLSERLKNKHDIKINI